MDVDEPQAVPYIALFNDVATPVFSEAVIEQIRARRAAMRRSLLFDDLLAAAKVRKSNILYPPEGQAGLEELLQAIANSTYDQVKKDCLIYYLLKWHPGKAAATFQQIRCIPSQFAALSDAYWLLDTGTQVSKAVALLSDARLNREFASKIIQALSLELDSAPLIRTYVQTAKPLLVDDIDISCYLRALAESSVLEAWEFQRTYGEGEPIRAALFRSLLQWAVTPRPRPAALTQLISLPLSTFEESVLTEFVLHPVIEFSAIAILQDLICVRLIQGGRYSDAIKLDRQFTAKTAPRDLHATKARSDMVQDIYAALPVIERSLIDLELDPLVPQKTPLTPKPPGSARRQPATAAVPEAENLSLSQSWEHVQMPGQLATPLKDVRVPPKPVSFGASPLNASTSSAHAASTMQPPPILPINFNSAGTSSSNTPLKNIPVPAKPGPRTSLGASLSGTAQRMGFSSMMASPASGMKVPPALASSSHAGATRPAPSAPIPATTTTTKTTTTTTATVTKATTTFVSASRQENAFYQPPPPKTNGVKRAFEEEKDSGVDDVAMGDGDESEDVETETEPAGNKSVNGVNGLGRSKNGHNAHEEEGASALNFSVFRPESGPSREELESAPAPGLSSPLSSPPAPAPRRLLSPPAPTNTRARRSKSPAAPAPVSALKASMSTSANKKKRAPPGSYISEEDDGMDESHDDAPPPAASTTRPKRSSRGTKTREPSAPPAASSAKPPAAKKPRQSKDTKIKDLSRSIPGGLMDDEDDDEHEHEHEQAEDENEMDEEDDVVPPLRRAASPVAAPPSRARGVKKSRSSMSVDPADETEGPQTRRRSSRLTAGSGSMNGGSAHGSPEPQPAPKTTRKGTRTGGAAAAKKKK